MVLTRNELQQKRTRSLLAHAVVAILQNRVRARIEERGLGLELNQLSASTDNLTFPEIPSDISVSSLSSTRTPPPVAMATFLLNPFQGDINLSQKEDKKLFERGSEGLKREEDKFNGDRKKYAPFMKLLKVAVESIKVMECMIISTGYDMT